MSKAKNEFPFDRARRITRREVDSNRRAIERKTGKKRKSRGRPKKPMSQRFKAISIRLHPKVIEWAKKEAKKSGIGYQTIINNYLMKKCA